MNGDVDLIRLIQEIGDEDNARDFLESLRWPNGAECPRCGADKPYKLNPKPTSNSPVRKGVYKCRSCRRQFTVTVGTIFEDSHIPLSKWLLAIHLMCSSKKGISAHQLHRMLGMTYKSAWFMCHRIRYAMSQEPLASKLSGVVEVDETYIGGKVRGTRRGTKDKPPVVALVERNGDVRAMRVPWVDGDNLKRIIRENVDPSTRVMTDGFPGYKGLDKEFASHETVDHYRKEYVRGDVTTNTVEGFFGLLKRGIIGTYHHVSEEHLDRYVDEFQFRWNARKVEDGTRAALAVAGAKGKRLTYRSPKDR
jgi:transposase-like protein